MPLISAVCLVLSPTAARNIAANDAFDIDALCFSA